MKPRVGEQGMRLLSFCITALATLTGVAGANPYCAADYAEFRRELRAFYPDECHGICKDPRQTNSVAAIGRDLDAWAAAHPGFDALDIRRESYLLMRRHVQPFLFKSSPFYFELGCNGGWCHNVRSVPGRHVNRLCSRFYKEKNLIPEEAFRLQSARSKQSLALCCGPFVDDMHHVPPFRTILEKGFGGVRAEVAAALKTCPKDDPLGRKELETALVGFDTVHEIQLKFREAALAALGESDSLSVEQSNNLRRIAEAANRCPWEPPRTFFEGLNTLWFIREVLGYVDGTDQFSLGRPDAWLVGLYRADLAAGRITPEEARELVGKFLVTADCHHDRTIPVNSYSDHEMEIPMSLGGCDKDGTWVFNELTEMFLDAHLGCDCVFPKLHCRISASAPKAYLEKIGEMLMAGHAVFTLLNDDRYLKQYVEDGFAPEDAREYVGVGCWNGFIDSAMDVDEANYLSIMGIVERTVHRDPELEKRLRLRIDSIDDATSIEEVREILYRNTIRFCRDIMGEYSRWGGANAKVFPHPVYSMCLRGCIESRRDTTDCGVPAKARPKIITLGFIGNVVDSVAAINQVCFVDKVCTVKEYLDAVRSNWAGARGEDLRRRAMNAPYWGDGSRFTTDELAWWMRSIRRDIDGCRNDQGGEYKLAIYTYREFMYWGAKMKATPDGRRDGDRLAQGFSPSEVKCRSGITTLMNAIGELPHESLYASNVNLTFDRSAMSAELLAAILQVFCEKGSHMIQPNCNSVEELVDAQRHPERHQDLIVRVCGFSAKFIYLSKRWQDEVIARHRLK